MTYLFSWSRICTFLKYILNLLSFSLKVLSFNSYGICTQDNLLLVKKFSKFIQKISFLSAKTKDLHKVVAFVRTLSVSTIYFLFEDLDLLIQVHHSSTLPPGGKVTAYFEQHEIFCGWSNRLWLSKLDGADVP